MILFRPWVCVCVCEPGMQACAAHMVVHELVYTVCACMSVCSHVCVQVHAHVVCLGSQLGLPLSGPSWPEVMGSYLYTDMLTQGIHLFLKSFSKHHLSKLNSIYICQGHSPFKEGLWEILCNEIELGFNMLDFYKGPSMPWEVSFELLY